MNLTPDDIWRFRNRVIWMPGDQCHVWAGTKLKGTSYGQFWLNAKFEYSHRVAFFIANGPFDEELNVLHTCDNPPCCNPQHLFLGTHKDNAQDCLNKGRFSEGERSGACRISDNDCNSLVELYQSGGFTQEQLAARFGISGSQASRIINGVYRKSRRAQCNR